MRFNLDWLLGPRCWCVIDDRLTGTADDIDHVDQAELLPEDEVLYRGLRRSAARCLAHDIRAERELRLRPILVRVPPGGASLSSLVRSGRNAQAASAASMGRVQTLVWAGCVVAMAAAGLLLR